MSDDIAFIQQQLLQPLIEKVKDILLVCHSFAEYSGTVAALGYSKRYNTAKGHEGGIVGSVFISAFLCMRVSPQGKIPNGSWPCKHHCTVNVSHHMRIYPKPCFWRLDLIVKPLQMCRTSDDYQNLFRSKFGPWTKSQAGLVSCLEPPKPVAWSKQPRLTWIQIVSAGPCQCQSFLLHISGKQHCTFASQEQHCMLAGREGVVEFATPHTHTLLTLCTQASGFRSNCCLASHVYNSCHRHQSCSVHKLSQVCLCRLHGICALHPR